MGCVSSSEKVSKKVDNERFDHIDETKEEIFGGFTVRYAYFSRRGHYPEEKNKPNQDKYSVSPYFCGQKSDAFFGVYDGHGPTGDKCAQFASSRIPRLVEKHIALNKKQNNNDGSIEVTASTSTEDSTTSNELNTKQIRDACLKAHVQCNTEMHATPRVDDSLSGTTAISVFIHGKRNRITVCNVGDSRAIIGSYPSKSQSSSPPPLGSTDEASLVAVPLSKDQTPYRSDERKRIRKTGARILSFGQITNGHVDQVSGRHLEEVGDDEIDENGDPPRVWAPDGEYPGTAFTRSIGDSLADKLGVFAEPEMITLELTNNDKILVLASDGVFEFLTNRTVIDICSKHSDPLDACRAVVKEAHDKWLEYERRSDDITMICIYIDNVGNQQISSSSTTTQPTAEASSSNDVTTPTQSSAKGDDPAHSTKDLIEQNNAAAASEKEQAVNRKGKHFRKTLITSSTK